MLVEQSEPSLLWRATSLTSDRVLAETKIGNRQGVSLVYDTARSKMA